jgi:hypothetical protein
MNINEISSTSSPSYIYDPVFETAAYFVGPRNDIFFHWDPRDWCHWKPFYHLYVAHGYRWHIFRWLFLDVQIVFKIG